MPKPKSERWSKGHRRFGSIRILADGRVRYSAWTVPDMFELQFMTHHVVINGDTHEVEYHYVSFTISVYWRDRDILRLVVKRRRVTDAGFPYDLTPDELRHAISILRKVGNGLERWITPGLLHLQRTLTNMERYKHYSPYRKALRLKPVVKRLLRSVRSIPLPRPWVQLQQDIEHRKRRSREWWERKSPLEKAEAWKRWERKMKRKHPKEYAEWKRSQARQPSSARARREA